MIKRFFKSIYSKQILLFFVFLFVFIGNALCEEKTFSPLYPLRKDAPKLTTEGFLPEDSDENYYLLIDKEAGEWTYIDKKLFINIRSFNDVVERKRTLVWYETEVKVAPGEKFNIEHANPEQIGRRFLYAEDFATKLNTILALSDDFYGFRVYQKRLPGVIIQNGEILADKSKKQPHWSLPTYDLIARYPDGTMKAYLAGSINAEELHAQGVTDTWCFGPVLLSEGEIGAQVLEKRFEYANPRQTIGMIKPNHYLIMTIEGRNSRSHGVGLVWVAERMRDLGCTEALNLDGGNSVKLVFMGKLINSDRTYDKKNDRSVTSLITLGYFPLETLEESKTE
ncbi:MAG: phosphodiester glycosidase family protein [Christensenellaceae bacterium]|nr:phosphodiester glycosidase family protein [Christensenellaceae bacterium]